MRYIILSLSFLYAFNVPNSFFEKFTQTIKSNDSTLTYKGKLYYKNGKLVWIYTYPDKKTIWIEDKVYIYEPDLFQVTIAPKKITLKDILNSAKKVKNNLFVAEIDGKKYYFVYDKYLKKLYYTDEMGNRVEIDFYDFSKKVDDKVFKINYPDDVDVIYQQ